MDSMLMQLTHCACDKMANISKSIFLDENLHILIHTSPKFIPDDKTDIYQHCFR